MIDIAILLKLFKENALWIWNNLDIVEYYYLLDYYTYLEERSNSMLDKDSDNDPSEDFSVDFSNSEFNKLKSIKSKFETPSSINNLKKINKI